MSWKCVFKCDSVFVTEIFGFIAVLKCLEVILQDESKALDDDCKGTLLKRLEMFRNAAVVSFTCNFFNFFISGYFCAENIVFLFIFLR